MRGRVLAAVARGAMIRADCAAPRSSQDVAAPGRRIAACWSAGRTECILNSATGSPIWPMSSSSTAPMAKAAARYCEPR